MQNGSVPPNDRGWVWYATEASDMELKVLAIIGQDVDRELRTFIHVKRAKRFDPVG